MKYRIIASIVFLVILITMAIIINGRNNSETNVDGQPATSEVTQ